MRRIIGFCFLVLLGLPLFVPSPARAQDTAYKNKEVSKEALRYEAYLRAELKPGRATSASLKAAGDKLLATDPSAATGNYALAVVADQNNVEAWLGLAEALLALPPEPSESNKRAKNAASAAFRAYERAASPEIKARALAVLAEALQKRSYVSWRPVLEAMKASLALADVPEARAAYEKLEIEHGFRMTDYKVDAESVSPRVCAEFSELLAGGETDFASFVTVDGREALSVSAEGSQVCIGGFAHGQRYVVKIRDGLPSNIGDKLRITLDLAIYVPDRKPLARFTGKSYVLPNRGQQGIPVVTVNTARVAVDIYRINDRNLTNFLHEGGIDELLSRWEIDELRERKGVPVYSGGMDVTSKLNEEITTAFPVSEAIGTLEPGVYAMVATPTGGKIDQYGERATQWFIVSDLGLTALSGDTGITAVVRSLSDTKPVTGVTVSLVARNNEVLATLPTDAQGRVQFEAGLARGEGGLAPAILVAKKDTGGDYAFLDLVTGAFDLSDRGVKGREAVGPIDGYLYLERGVFRPGEIANLTALVRDRTGKAVDLPITVIVSRPDGVEHQRLVLADQGAGGRTTQLAFGAQAMTGAWSAKLYTDPKGNPITEVAFLVEDFTPERMDLTLASDKPVLEVGGAVSITATGRYLYGPPAADIGVEGDIVIKKSAKDAPGFEGYLFGLADETIEPVRQPLEGLPKTGPNGVATFEVVLPAIPKTAQPLEAELFIRLREAGGRTIERNITVSVNAEQPRIGVKPLFGPTGPPENGNAGFEIVALDGDGKSIAAQRVSWELMRLETSWQWYSRNGNWSYEAVTLTRKASSGTFDIDDDAPAKLETPLTYGRYRLQITSPEPGGPATSVVFTAGWNTAQDAPDTPEMLDVALDKPSYKPGDTAKLRIASKEGGRAMVVLAGGGVLDMQETDLPAGGGDISFAVNETWGAGTYAAVFVYRPMDTTAKRMPSRAVGVTWVPLDLSERTLQVVLSPPEKMKSGASLIVPVKIEGAASGETVHLTVAAVDLGILNLTRFEPPAPDKWFHAQTKLGLEIRDFYGRLIDGMRAERGALRSGGDGGLEIQGAPPVEETLAQFSGIVTVGKDGTAEVEFPMPDFNGTVRLMAVAWSRDRLGHAAKDVIVRDEVALTASVPRFLTLGDEARFDIALHNVDGPASAYLVTLDQSTPVGVDVATVRLTDQALDLGQGVRKSLQRMVKPTTAGRHTFAVHVTGPENIAVKRQLVLDVKPPASDIKRTLVSQLQAKGGKLTLTADLIEDMIPDRTRISVSVGSVAKFDMPGLLAQLDRYPYGCAEQTVSKALPLLYVNSVATKLGIATDTTLKTKVQAAVDRVFEMQDSTGAFGAWGPANEDMWLTSYVTDFLIRAKESGYVVNPRGLSMAFDRLQNFLSITEERKSDEIAENRAYALYVLARSGRVDIGVLRYWADTKIDTFKTALAKAQLGAALAMRGDKERADRVFRAALPEARLADTGNTPRTDYGSRLRDGAALITLAAETGTVPDETPRLAAVIAGAHQSRETTSTQEQAWLLLAAHALSQDAGTATLSVNGVPHTGLLLRSLTAADLKSGALTIVNDSDSVLDAVVTVTGASLTPEPPVSRGFTISRSYYTLDGKPVDLAAKPSLPQNTRLVAVVKIASPALGGRVLLVDRLPAGFEIENPRLVTSGDIASLAWLQTSVQPIHTEFRDDRFVAAFDFFATPSSEEAENESLESEPAEEGAEPAEGVVKPPTGTTATVAYIVRAVTPGTFVHPAATVEDMYRPERYARSATGKVQVTAGE